MFPRSSLQGIGRYSPLFSIFLQANVAMRSLQGQGGGGGAVENEWQIALVIFHWHTSCYYNQYIGRCSYYVSCSSSYSIPKVFIIRFINIVLYCSNRCTNSSLTRINCYWTRDSVVTRSSYIIIIISYIYG